MQTEADMETDADTFVSLGDLDVWAVARVLSTGSIYLCLRLPPPSPSTAVVLTAVTAATAALCCLLCFSCVFCLRCSVNYCHAFNYRSLLAFQLSLFIILALASLSLRLSLSVCQRLPSTNWNFFPHTLRIRNVRLQLADFTYMCHKQHTHTHTQTLLGLNFQLSSVQLILMQ